MAYHFTSKFELDYVDCRVEGKNTSQNVRRFLNDVLNACVQHNCSHALLEENFTGPSLNFTEIYGIIADASQKTWPHVKRIAFIDANPEHPNERMQFAETVARNRGVLAQFFDDREKAIQWLKK